MLMSWLITFAYGGLAAYVAKKQNRNPLLWFAFGCFFPLGALLLLMAIFPLLGIFLRRMVARAIQQPSARRREKKEEDNTIDVEATPVFDLTPPDPTTLQKLWYFLDKEGVTIGPMSFSAFCERWKRGEIFARTLVWNETLEAWTPFQQLFPSSSS